MPTAAPKLLEKRSKQLLVVPGDTYRGDGPIVFTKILYTPEKNGGSWSSIIGTSSKELFGYLNELFPQSIRLNGRFLPVYSDKKPITLMNLEPSTRYRVHVQLSRPGEGGEGAAGPETIMETECPGKKMARAITQMLFVPGNR